MAHQSRDFIIEEVGSGVYCAVRAEKVEKSSCCEIDACQPERKPLNTEAEEPLPGNA
jgi:hypothetical protein